MYMYMYMVYIAQRKSDTEPVYAGEVSRVGVYKCLEFQMFRSFEGFCLYRSMGVSAPSLHRESADTQVTSQMVYF